MILIKYNLNCKNLDFFHYRFNAKLIQFNKISENFEKLRNYICEGRSLIFWFDKNISANLKFSTILNIIIIIINSNYKI